MTTHTWAGTATALTSIAHGGETRGHTTLLRRERVVQPDGSLVDVPIISGNAFRGRLRRIGEELLRDTLHYDDHLPLAAAHALRGGGSLAKTSHEPLSGQRLRTLRHHIPQVGVFGCAAGGRIIDSALQVGKLTPILQETAHITPHSPHQGRFSPTSAFAATQLETYTRTDDTDRRGFPTTTPSTDLSDQLEDRLTPSQLMLFRVETFPAGTRFTTWLQLTHATALELAFFLDVLATYTAAAVIGGRSAVGHGHLSIDLAATPTLPSGLPDWRAHLREHRGAALTALQDLT